MARHNEPPATFDGDGGHEKERLPIRDEFLVLERVRVHDAPERVPEDVLVVPPLELFEVTVHVLHAHLVEAADDGALEQAPDALDRVGVDIAHDPLLGAVLHALVARVAVADPAMWDLRTGREPFDLESRFCFTKPKALSYQSEYRFALWTIGEPTDGALRIPVSDALRECTSVR